MIICITGATSGFGHAMVERFLHSGHKVIGMARREDRLVALKAKWGEQFLALTVDVGNKKDVGNAIASIPKDFLDIDVLVNNAGLALGVDPAFSANVEDWEEMVQTNINGVLYCTHYILPLMVARNSGHIVNLGSVAGEFPYPGGNVYGATKAFVHQFSLNLKADLLGKNIRVTNIEPGMCESEFSLVRFRGDEQKAQSVYQGMKPLTPIDIAETIEWVISRPKHVNINTISLMPVDQAFGPFSVSRQMLEKK